MLFASYLVFAAAEDNIIDKCNKKFGITNQEPVGMSFEESLSYTNKKICATYCALELKESEQCKSLNKNQLLHG